MISFCNFVICNIIDDFCNSCCVVRVNKFRFVNAAFSCKLLLKFALSCNFFLSKFNSVHNIFFCNEFCACFNHDYRIVSTCYNDINIRFCSVSIRRVSNKLSVNSAYSYSTDRAFKRSFCQHQSC